MKEVKIYDQEKYDWALDSALKALSREDKKSFYEQDLGYECSKQYLSNGYFIYVCSKRVFNQPAIEFYFWRT